MVNLLFKSLKYTRDKYHVKAKEKCFGWRLLSKRRLKKNSRGSISNQTSLLPPLISRKKKKRN